MGKPVMEDARATPICSYMIMHHTYFWEEFIDKGGRPCGRVVNISHWISDLVGQSSLCVIVCVPVYEFVRACPCASNNV